MEQTVIGIDVAKDRLDVHVRPSGEAFSVARDGKGLDELVSRLGKLDVALIVLEATGGFETMVAGTLCAAGLPLAVVNPRQIRDFARATGRLAKTDALDAAVIAHFAGAIRPEPRPVPDEQARALGELVTRRRQIVEMMAVERGRRKRLADRVDSCPARCVDALRRVWRSVPRVRCAHLQLGDQRVRPHLGRAVQRVRLVERGTDRYAEPVVWATHLRHRRAGRCGGRAAGGHRLQLPRRTDRR